MSILLATDKRYQGLVINIEDTVKVLKDYERFTTSKSVVLTSHRDSLVPLSPIYFG